MRAESEQRKANSEKLRAESEITTRRLSRLLTAAQGLSHSPFFSSARIQLKPLAQLCDRLATATNAGLDDRRIWRDEQNRGNQAQRAAAQQICQRLARGAALADALQDTGDYFPPLFLQMAAVGETSGQHGRIYKRLATYYQRQLAARRSFLGKIAWPLLELAMAVFVIGLFIWIMGMLPANRGADGQSTDLLGWGLVGTRGLILYIFGLLLIGIGLLLVVRSIRRQIGWAERFSEWILQLPLIGTALKTLALARFTWAMHLVLDTPMDLRRALPLALETTGSRYYTRHTKAIVSQIEQGRNIPSALAATGCFPSDLLDAIATGEQSGQLVEQMGRLSDDYQERATLAVNVLAQVAGYGTWILVAALIIVMIFQLFSQYVAQIERFL
jgi:type II secretory pathway component PulF